jgi:lipoate-protein ligase B
MNDAALTTAWLGTVDYEQGLALQEALVAARHADALGDVLLLLEHPHVYTLGRGADARYLVAPPPGVPVNRVSRGGQVTYHGPGQLIGYPILKLEGAARDIHKYVRALERAIIEALAVYGIDAGRREKLTGVWVGERKIASIGIGIRRWITLHGFALNVNTDLRFFEHVVPCGIEGCRMTSLARECRADIDITEAAVSMAQRFAAVFGYGSIASVGPAELWRFIDRQFAQGFEADGG